MKNVVFAILAIVISTISVTSQASAGGWSKTKCGWAVNNGAHHSWKTTVNKCHKFIKKNSYVTTKWDGTVFHLEDAFPQFDGQWGTKYTYGISQTKAKKFTGNVNSLKLIENFRKDARKAKAAAAAKVAQAAHLESIRLAKRADRVAKHGAKFDVTNSAANAIRAAIMASMRGK